MNEESNVSEPILAWHFLPADRKLRYGDGRLALDGETLSCPDEVEPRCCDFGMHGSRRLSDALRYSPGLILCRVEISGEPRATGPGLHEQLDKLTGRHRKIIWSIEIPILLVVQYADWCAKRAKMYAAHAATYAAAAHVATYAAARAAHAATYAAAHATYAANAAAARAAHAATYAAAHATYAANAAAAHVADATAARAAHAANAAAAHAADAAAARAATHAAARAATHAAERDEQEKWWLDAVKGLTGRETL